MVCLKYEYVSFQKWYCEGGQFEIVTDLALHPYKKQGKIPECI